MLPFSVDEFFATFAAYNSAIWPTQILGYLLGALTVAAILVPRPWTGRTVAAVLSLMWVWNGLVYHPTFFTRVNPTAYGFASLFVLQGLLFLGYGTVGGRLRFTGRISRRGVLGMALIVYATILYTALGCWLGHTWPSLPIFGVAPCPTAIFSFGVLMLAAGSLPLWLLAIPIVWAVIGSTAALLLDVPEDLGLFVSGVLGAVVLPFAGHCRASRAAAASAYPSRPTLD